MLDTVSSSQFPLSISCAGFTSSQGAGKCRAHSIKCNRKVPPCARAEEKHTGQTIFTILLNCLVVSCNVMQCGDSLKWLKCIQKGSVFGDNFVGFRSGISRWCKFKRQLPGICLFYPTAFFLADCCRHSTFDASQEMLQGEWSDRSELKWTVCELHPSANISQPLPTFAVHVHHSPCMSPGCKMQRCNSFGRGPPAPVRSFWRPQGGPRADLRADLRSAASNQAGSDWEYKHYQTHMTFKVHLCQIMSNISYVYICLTWLRLDTWCDQSRWSETAMQLGATFFSMDNAR